MNRFFIIVLVLAIPVVLVVLMNNGVFAPFSDVFDPERPIVLIGDTQLQVEILDTEAARIQGLSGRESLPTNTGVLFIFREDDYHGIWMREMLMSIDIIWINRDHQVVHIEKNVHPDTFPKVFEPTVPARYVIEVPSRYTDSFGIKIGDEVELPSRIIPSDLR